MSLSKLERRKQQNGKIRAEIARVKHNSKINKTKEVVCVLIKPGFACYQNIVWDITSMIKQKGLKIEVESTEFLTRDVVAKHYPPLKEKPFYNELVDYMVSDFVVKMVVSGKNAVKIVRDLCGATDPANAAEGTIRKKY